MNVIPRPVYVSMFPGETLSKEARRALTLVSKILQNLANDTKFKEDYLVFGPIAEEITWLY